jgi:CubicO group peptidase (beta-lactamase class C family)
MNLFSINKPLFQLSSVVALLLTSFNGLGQSIYFPPVGQNNWDTLSASDLNFCPSQTQALHDYLDSTNTKAFMLLKDGKIVFEWYFGNFTVDSTWYWASAGKTLTAFGMGIIQKEYNIDFNESVSNFLGIGWSSLTPQQESDIKIHHLLSMTSGLDYQVSNLNCTLPTCLLYRAPAGSQWYYHNAPYLLLPKVAEANFPSNLSFNAYLWSRLHTVIGTSIIFLDIPGNSPHVAFSKARDMARFGLLVSNNGRWGQLPAFVDSSFSTTWMNPSQQLNPSYGYLWWLNSGPSYMMPGTTISFPGRMIPNAPTDLITAAGLNEQRIYIVPSEGWVIIRMGEASGLSGAAISLYDRRVWDKINALRCQSTSFFDPRPKQVIKLFPNPAKDFIVIEGISEELNYEVSNVTGKVVIRGKVAKRISVKDLSPGLYFLTISGIGVSKFIVAPFP